MARKHTTSVMEPVDEQTGSVSEDQKNGLYHQIKQSMLSEDGYMFLPDTTLNQLDPHLIESDAGIRNAQGDMAVRLSQAGVERFQDSQNGTNEAPAKKEKVARVSEPVQAVVFEDDIPIPKSTRVTASRYNFDKMNVGQSFFIADTDERNAKKMLIPAVSNANRKFKESGMHWIVRSVPHGARVWRRS